MEVDWCEGNVLCLRPATPRLHTIVSPGNVAYSYVAVTATAFGGLDALSLYELPSKYSGVTASLMGEIIERAQSIAATADPIKRDIECQFVAIELVRAIVGDAPLRGGAMQTVRGIARVAPALEHLATHFHETPDITEISSLCCLSPSRFHAVFKLATGGTPYGVLTRHRLERSAQLLATTDLSVSDVGEAVGWPDAFHFSRTFKHHYGLSPRAYRARASAGMGML